MTEIGIQVKPMLTINTTDLIPSIIGRVDLSEVGCSYVPLTSNSVQAIPELKDTGVQTLLSSFNQGLETIISNSDLRINADILEFGFGDTQASSIIRELTDKSLQTSVELINKGVQTKPNMTIDLSSIKAPEIDLTLLEFERVLETIDFADLAILEAYVPFPELIVDVTTAIGNYYPMCLG
jgi:hypothetical protein